MCLLLSLLPLSSSPVHSLGLFFFPFLSLICHCTLLVEPSVYAEAPHSLKDAESMTASLSESSGTQWPQRPHRWCDKWVNEPLYRVTHTHSRISVISGSVLQVICVCVAPIRLWRSTVNPCNDYKTYPNMSPPVRYNNTTRHWHYLDVYGLQNSKLQLLMSPDAVSPHYPYSFLFPPASPVSFRLYLCSFSTLWWI